MADSDDLENLDLGEEKKSSKKLFIIIGGVVGLLILIGAILFFTGVFSSDEEAGPEDGGEEQVEETVVAPPIYFELKGADEKNFIVPLHAPGAKLMQVGMSVMSRDQAVIDLIEKHLPRIRNDLLLLLADQEPEKLKTAKGKEKLKEEILEAVKKVVEAQGGEKEAVEDLFFTGFVMQ